ncbi:LLM class flavin-dependent oxidoreductase [Rhodoplanes sp. Z2-YC6860]|uniref:LLM class flavin-dependent oxidoreductase n=1 Tax=Rhodoplanes sp. Z2-YC6860 TaxID=674703 RepID=UPI00078B86DA|nr:LLM class flavin-dependent oxidoreductase [Rhodoplanes sp. Z2-YC6860]AMN43164.1 luciferase family protein [Rhodoplanes sp. Z2-YC6860]
MTDQVGTKSNPIRDSKNRIKLGVFGISGNGAAFTFHPDRFKCSWDANVRLAQKAEKLGLEAFVSAMHWKSFGGDDHYSGDFMEAFTWAGAVAAVTERIAVVSTLHVTLMHPVFVAKAAATVDLISKGRAGMNLVLGWYPGDMKLFGYEVKEHSDRFELAEEWMEIFDRLWSGRKSFDYDGQNYKLKDAYSQPHGVQARPVLFNAGRSPRGREFAAKHCDIAFVSAHNPDPKAIKQQVEEYRKDAREKFGKEIQIWMSAYVVLKDTTAEAQAYAYDYIVTQGDDEPVQNIIRNNAIDTKAMPPEAAAKLAYALKAGFAGYPLVGDADRITSLFTNLSDAGVDGFLLTWLDYEGGLERFGREVLPRLEKAGLRVAVDAKV